MLGRLFSKLGIFSTIQTMKYSNQYTIRNIEIDPEYRIKPYHLCSYAQDTVASLFADIGCASYDLQREGQSWILTGMYTEFGTRLPAWRSAVKVEVWVRKIRGLQYLFDFQVSPVDGEAGEGEGEDADRALDHILSVNQREIFARGTSSWSIIDENARKLARRRDIADSMEILPEEACPDIQLRRIEKYDGPETTFSQTVHNYDIDFNGHLNSIRYIGGALEAIPLEYRRGRALKSLHIKYSHEAVTGDHITCSCHHLEGTNAFYHRLFNQREEDLAFMNTVWSEG
ncbi:MAG: acyl-[acyl-carrier-protein] thioesterase [Sediminispirochaetaceae bacterium]